MPTKKHPKTRTHRPIADQLAAKIATVRPPRASRDGTRPAMKPPAARDLFARQLADEQAAHNRTKGRLRKLQAEHQKLVKATESLATSARAVVEHAHVVPDEEAIYAACRAWHQREVTAIATRAIAALKEHRAGSTRVMAVAVPNRMTAKGARLWLDEWLDTELDRDDLVPVLRAMFALRADVLATLELADGWNYDDDEASDDTKADG